MFQWPSLMFNVKFSWILSVSRRHKDPISCTLTYGHLCLAGPSRVWLWAWYSLTVIIITYSEEIIFILSFSFNANNVFNLPCLRYFNWFPSSFSVKFPVETRKNCNDGCDESCWWCRGRCYFENNVGRRRSKVKCHAMIAVVVRRDLMCSWLHLCTSLLVVMRLHITKYFITITGWLIALPLSRREASRAAAEIIFNEENASAGERRES